MNEDKSARYHRLKRRSAVLSGLWSTVLLGGLLLSGASIALRSAAGGYVQAIAGPSETLATVAAFTLLLVFVHELGAWPIAFYSGFVVEHRYGVSRQPLSDWLGDQMKSLALAAVLAVSASLLLYGTIHLSPGWWWLAAGLGFSALAAGLTLLGPVVFLPIFYPMRKLDHDILAGRLLALSRRAGTRVTGIYEWGVERKTRKANAALAGLGRTRRILVSDTMLADYSVDEVEVVLAHELGHHVHGDLWKALVAQSLVTLLGLAAAAWCLEAVGPALGLDGPADAAGLPLILLAVGAVSFAARPLQLALSREAERRADRFALSITRNPNAFVSAMRRLSAQNLAEPSPSRLVRWWFYSHPPIEERIGAAQAIPGRSVTGAV